MRAACLAMILAYYGKWVPLEQVRSDCGVSRDGASAKNVLRAARSYHMTAKGFRYEPETLRKKGSFPCIIHWNFNHFVVLCGFSKKGALLNDPARGRVTVSWEEFDRSFTGICRMFSPEEGFEKGGSRRSILGFVKERLRGTGPAFLFVVLTRLIAAAAGILNPVFSRVFLDRILTGENPEWLPPLLGLMAVVAFCQISVSIIQAVHMSKIEGKLAIEANASFMWHVLRLPMEFFSQRLAGDLAVRQSSNEGIASSLIRQLAPSLLNFVMLAFYLLVMLRYSPILTAVGLFSVLINVTAARLISKRRGEHHTGSDAGCGKAFRRCNGGHRNDRKHQGVRGGKRFLSALGGLSGVGQCLKRPADGGKPFSGGGSRTDPDPGGRGRAASWRASDHAGRIFDRRAARLPGLSAVLLHPFSIPGGRGAVPAGNAYEGGADRGRDELCSRPGNGGKRRKTGRGA